MTGRHTHPGWTERFQLDPDLTRMQGGAYTEACALVVRDMVLRRWVDDPRGTQWHPAHDFRLRIEVEGTYQQGHTTWLIAELDAVYRPAGVPADVLDHEHTDECEHIMVPFVSGHCCDHCGNLGTRWRLCPWRCAATAYAANRALEYYSPPGQTA